MEIELKLNVISYEHKGNLIKIPIPDRGRISKIRALDILSERALKADNIFKVSMENCRVKVESVEIL